MNLPLSFPFNFVIWLCIILLILYLWFKKNQTLFPYPIWWWQYIFFLRVPIIAALILLYFPIIATKSGLSYLLLILYFVIIALCTCYALCPSKVTILVIVIVLNFIFHFVVIPFIDISSLFENLFVMTKSFQLGISFVTITSTSLMVSLVFSTIFINVPIRYHKELNIISNCETDDNELPGLINTCISKLSSGIKYRYFLSILLSLPSCITIVSLSWQDATITDNLSDIWKGIGWGFFFSVLFYLIVFCFAFIIRRTENTNIEFFFTKIWRKILKFRKEDYSGYLYSVSNENENKFRNKFRFESGHVLGISLGSIGSIFYLYLGAELIFIESLLIIAILLIMILFSNLLNTLPSFDLFSKDSLVLIGIGLFNALLIFEIVHLNFLSSDFPALMYLLLIIWVVTCLLGGATFYTDRYHIPLLTALILFSGFSYLIFNVDHFFKLNPVSIKEEHLELRLDNADKFYEKISDFQNPLKNRLAKQKKEDKTLVLIAASGGGIQAAGWTAQVLQGLNEQLSNSFTNSIGMISSVSGGSVGNMFFLNELINSKHDGNKNLNQYLETALDNSMTDSLDAVGWGLAYPDFFRGIGMPFFDRYIDRASALDKDWEQTMKQEENPPTLQSWREHIWDGDIPIPVFNATLVEDGRRFLISPLKFIHVSLSEIFVKDKSSQSSPGASVLDFYTLFQIPKPEQTCNGQEKHDTDKIYDLKISTAARLSASFPYVSPLARNYPGNCIKINKDDKTFNYHVADGGYFDNAGIHTIIEWLTKGFRPKKLSHSVVEFRPGSDSWRNMLR